MLAESREPLLLDTCAVIWIDGDEPLSAAATEAMNLAFAGGQAAYVSPITAWEIGMLVARGRLSLPFRPQVWFQQVLELPGVRLAEMSPEVLILSSFLPGRPPRDPADRIIAATAREYGYRLVTRDGLLLSYAEEGHIQAIAC